MGSSDRTCAVSHLPIQYKDPCRMIFLRQVLAWDDDLEPGDWQHVWTQWLPLGLPVKGLYDGYGRVMAGYSDKVPKGQTSPHMPYDPDAVLRFQIESIARVAEPLPKDEGWGALADFPNTIESLMSACERGWLRVRLPRPSLRDEVPPTPVVCRVSPMYVSERAWQAVTSGSDDGIGVSRARLEKHYGNDILASLRSTVEHYRDWPARREEMRETLAMAEESAEEVEKTMALLERVWPRNLDGLGSQQERAPDILVAGYDSTPDIQLRTSLYDFGDDDWAKLAELVLDTKVFFATYMHELRRHVHPEMYSDQFHLPDGGLDQHRMLAVYIQKWCQEMEDDYERETRQWEEQQAAEGNDG